MLRLKKRPPKGWTLVYGDESDVSLNPLLGRVWHRKGKSYQVTGAGKNYKVHVFGALNTKTGRVTYLIFRRKRSVEFLEFLKHLLKQYRRWKIYLVLDNFKIHDTKIIRDFIKKQRKRLRIVWLPTYSPYLNLIERFWRYMKDQTVRNYFFKDVVKLIQALNGFFKRYHDDPRISIMFEEHKICKAA